MNIQTIKNVSDCKPLYLPHSLYLKPLAKIHLSVALPTAITGKTICNRDVIEQIRNLVYPDTFAALRVSIKPESPSLPCLTYPDPLLL